MSLIFYSLKSNNLSACLFLAIDNCLNNNCSHECVTDWNSPGGFRCACDLGYDLKDGNNCIRMFSSMDSNRHTHPTN